MGAVSVAGAVSVNSGNTQLLTRPFTGNSDLEPHFETTLDSTIDTVITKFPKIALYLRVPDFKSAAAKMLAAYTYYFFPDYDDSQEPKRESKKALCELVLNNTEPFNIVFPYIAVPGCGHLKPERFLDVVISLCESAYLGTFPKKVISIGSGQAFLEKCFSLMGDVNVKCYDREPLTRFLPVEQAEFPKDINNCLPDDCRDCLLVSGYPQGFLGPVLLEFIRRGGEMLCTTVEGSLFSDMHEGYEADPKVLRNGIKELRKKNGEFFEVKLTEYTMMGPESYIQFYNWPSSVKQLMLGFSHLKDLCVEIDFPEPM